MGRRPNPATPPSSAQLLAPVRRWTGARKEAVVLAVRRRQLTLGQVMQAHGLSLDEYQAWQRDFLRHGRIGLAVTHMQALPR
ncbi:DUF1153 domain-containing protein [Caulobacter sp. CCNWLY153]|uniref:DUF1153 domain-containing protein n=1 Tax=unclassified Caulobacter TaxID=2648921 RepID=UPI002FF1B5BA